MRPAQRRAWVLAVALSVLAHAALLGSLALVAHHVLGPPAHATAPPAVAKRGPIMRVSVRSSAPPATGAQPPLEAPRPHPLLGAPHSPPGVVHQPSPAPEAPPGPAAGDEAPASATDGSGDADSTGLPASGAPPGPAPGSASGTTAAPAPTNDLLGAQVHARLAAAAAGCYPSAAHRFRQRGTVTVSFCVTASLTGTSLEVRQSSGLPMLDSASACVVDHAAPFPAQAAQQCFTVPIRFGR